jgi:hypothetical protein
MDHGQLIAFGASRYYAHVRSDTPVTQNEVCIKPGMLHGLLGYRIEYLGYVAVVAVGNSA